MIVQFSAPYTDHERPNSLLHDGHVEVMHQNKHAPKADFCLKL